MAPNHLTAQQYRHQIALQTGLFHYFFDKSPILNVNYPNTYRTPNLFNGLLINSFAINYTFRLTEKSNLSFEYSSFRINYSKYQRVFEKHPVIGERTFSTFTLNYVREKEITKRFLFLYGGGINYRHGLEGIILTHYPMADGGNELIYAVVLRKDIGLNTFAGIKYNFSNHFFFYSKVDLLGTVYFHDQKGKQKMDEIFNSPQFPSRFDSSLKLGIGVQF